MPAKRDTPERNSVIECYLLHLRILIEFFRATRRLPNDVIASDYVPNWNATEHSEELKEAWNALNKRLTHLTAERANTVAWPLAQQSWQQAHDIVGSLWTRFETELDAERRSWFKREVSAS